MNRTQFISFVESPEKLGVTENGMLSELIKNFPYFQTSHLLYAKSLHNQNSIHYNNQLKIAAAYAADRKLLHRLITNQSAEVKDFVLESGIQISSEEKQIEKVIQHMIDEEIVERNITVVEEKGLVFETKQEDKKFEKAAHQLIEQVLDEKNIVAIIDENRNVTNESISENLIEKTPELKQAKLDELELEILAEAISADLELEKNETEFIQTFSTEIKSIVKNKEVDSEKTTELADAKSETKIETIIEDLTFSNWLIYLNSGVSNETISRNEKSTTKNSTAPSQFDLIDKFISDEPTISKPKVEFFNPATVAKQSVEDDITFTTETLAKIYELQGNYSKALMSYENLYAKYPKKKLYFAAQINKLKKLINQQKQ